jgi:hypothetical protein
MFRSIGPNGSYTTFSRIFVKTDEKIFYSTPLFESQNRKEFQFSLIALARISSQFEDELANSK